MSKTAPGVKPAPLTITVTWPLDLSPLLSPLLSPPESDPCAPVIRAEVTESVGRFERAQGAGYLDARGPAQVGQRGAQISCLLSMQAVELVPQRGALCAIADLRDSGRRLLISLGELPKRGERGGVIAATSGGVERGEGRAGALEIILRGGR